MAKSIQIKNQSQKELNLFQKIAAYAIVAMLVAIILLVLIGIFRAIYFFIF